MFEPTVAGGGRSKSVLLSLALQLGAVALLLILPLLSVRGLPAAAPEVLPATLLPSVATERRPPRAAITMHRVASGRAAPEWVVPRSVPNALPSAAAPSLAPTAPGWSAIPGAPSGPLPEFGAGVPLAAQPAPPATIRVGGEVAAANCLSCPPPGFPPLAKQAGIQGSVVLRAMIGPDGAIEQVQLVSGHPLLVTAAMAAVRRWRYRPTRLNGRPVAVATEITIDFRLGR